MNVFNKIKDRINSKVNDIIQSGDDDWEDFPSFLDDEEALQKQNKSQDVPYYAKIPLLDTGLIQEGGRVYDLLKKNGINTVGQILDDNLMEKVKQGTTYPENIDFLVNFIKNKYEGISLSRTRFLDEKIITDKNISFDTFRLNCCNPNNFEFDYLKLFKEEVELGNLNEDSKFIDFFRNLISDANCAKKIVPNKEIIKLYVSDYDKYKLQQPTEDEMLKYDDILLKETGFYASYDNYLYSTLKSRGITTVGQILDDDIMFGVKKHFKDIERLTIFIDIIKNQYLGIPLPQVAIFDELIVNTKYFDFEKFLFIKKTYRQIYVDNGQFDFLGDLEKSLSGDKIYVSKNYKTVLKFAKHHGYLNDDSTYIDYFKFLLSEDNTWLDIKEQDKRVLEIYINEYQKQKHEGLNETENLEKLKEELSKLIELRDNLDKKISEIIKSIAEYEEKVSSKGSM